MATPSSPKVSVCIPVYNGSEYIAKTIRSILSQTFENFQIIVCDNCSEDDTEEIVRSFDDSRINFVRNEKNLGLVGNANRCIDLADGEYIHIIHHDDLMMPKNLEKKVRILDENPGVGLVYSDVMPIDQDGIPLDIVMFRETKRNYIEDGRKVFERYVLKMNVGASFFIGSVLVRRECYLRLGGFNPQLPYNNDNEMWLRILLFYDAGCIGEPLVKYRIHNSMTSSAINDTDGLNIVGLKEHYLACTMVMDQYGDKIPNKQQLKKKMRIAFSMRTLTKGKRLIRKRKMILGAQYIFASMQFFPAIVMKKDFWTLFTSSLANRLKKK